MSILNIEKNIQKDLNWSYDKTHVQVLQPAFLKPVFAMLDFGGKLLMFLLAAIFIFNNTQPKLMLNLS